MTAPTRTAKTVTRRRVRATRRERSPAERLAAGLALAERAAEVAELAAGPVGVAVFASLGDEPGTGPLRDRLARLGHRLLLPVLLDDLDLDWVPDRGTGAPLPDPLRPAGARLGPDVVTGCAVVLVPALAVDRQGTRLGQGGGSYDRVLARLATAGAAPLVLAVVHDGEVLPPDEQLPREDHDVPVDGALTPSGLLRFAP